MEPCRKAAARCPRLGKAWSAGRTSSVHNRPVIPLDGEREGHGEPIATGWVASTGNEVVRQRFGTKHQRQWSKAGAHGLWQTRGRTRNGACAGIFKRWYPDLDMQAAERPMAA
jgi:hypothetical protein